MLCLAVALMPLLMLEQAGWLTILIMLVTALAESRVHQRRMIKMKGV